MMYFSQVRHFYLYNIVDSCKDLYNDYIKCSINDIKVDNKTLTNFNYKAFNKNNLQNIVTLTPKYVSNKENNKIIASLVSGSRNIEIGHKKVLSEAGSNSPPSSVSPQKQQSEKKIIHRVKEESLSHITGNFRSGSPNHRFTDNSNGSVDSKNSKISGNSKNSYLTGKNGQSKVEIFVNKRRHINLTDNSSDKVTKVKGKFVINKKVQNELLYGSPKAAHKLSPSQSPSQTPKSTIKEKRVKIQLHKQVRTYDYKSPPLIIKESKNIFSAKKLPPKQNKLAKGKLNSKDTSLVNKQFEQLSKGPTVKKQNLAQQLINYNNQSSDTNNTKSNLCEKETQNDFSFKNETEAQELIETRESEQILNMKMSNRMKDV